MYKDRFTSLRHIDSQYSVFLCLSKRPWSTPGVCGNDMYTICSRICEGNASSDGFPSPSRCCGSGGGMAGRMVVRTVGLSPGT